MNEVKSLANFKTCNLPYGLEFFHSRQRKHKLNYSWPSRTVRPSKYLQCDVKGTPSVSKISCRKVPPDIAASDHLHNTSSGCSCVKKTLKTKRRVPWALEEKLSEVLFFEPRDIITPVKTMNQPTLRPAAPLFYPARYRNNTLWMDAFKVVPVVNIKTDQNKQ